MQRGQASLEYVVVVALIALVCAAGTAVAVAAEAGPGLVNGIGRQFKRALCLVGGGDCLATEYRPCVTASEADDETLTVHVAFVRIGDHAGILREQLSDGSVNITEIDDLSAGGETGMGIHARLKLGKRAFEAGGELQAQAVAELGRGHTYHVRDGRAADKLMKRLVHGSPKTLVVQRAWGFGKRLLGFEGRSGVPPADATTTSLGAEGAASARLGAGAGAHVDAGMGAAVGRRVERATGRRTLFFDVRGEAGGTLRAAVAQGRLNGAGDLGVAVTYDRHGHPLQLTVSAAGDGAGSLGPAGRVADLPGADRLHVDGSGRLEVEDRLDLTDPDDAAAVDGLVSALRHLRPRAAVAAARDVAGHLAAGSFDLRAYRTTTSSDGAGADAALGAKLGADLSIEHSSRRLAAAWSRPAGGVWEKRLDCLGEV